MEQRNYVTLKWGTTKSYSFPDKPEAIELIKELDAIDETIVPDEPCIRNRQTDRQKEIICQLIDMSDGDTIYTHWNGDVSKDEAKEYVMTYGEEPTPIVEIKKTKTIVWLMYLAAIGTIVGIIWCFFCLFHGLVITFFSVMAGCHSVDQRSYYER